MSITNAYAIIPNRVDPRLLPKPELICDNCGKDCKFLFVIREATLYAYRLPTQQWCRECVNNEPE
jgi:hypothetical protein